MSGRESRVELKPFRACGLGDSIPDAARGHGGYVSRNPLSAKYTLGASQSDVAPLTFRTNYQ